MHTSDTPNRQFVRSGLAVTFGLAAIVALLLAAIAALVPLDTRNARGATQERTALDVWRTMLDSVPADAPFFLIAGTLTVLSFLGLFASAYVIVAVARLPR